MSKRRGHGDGGLIQRHDHPTCPPLVDGERAKHACKGRWVGTLVARVDGRNKRMAYYGRTRAEAKAKLDKAIAEKKAGTLVTRHVTLAAWLSEWLDRKERALKPQTIRGYRSVARTYLIPHLGRYRLADLEPEHIERMYDAMRGAGLAEATVRQSHAILNACLRDAVKRDKIARNPVDRADAPTTKKNRREQFTAEQARRVLAAADDDARWWLALFYGVRQGEVLGLRWENVDFERGTIRISETLQLGLDGKQTFGTPKSESSKRTLPMVPHLAARMRLHWEIEGRPTSGLVFHGRDGRPIQRKADWLAWRALIDRATTPPLAPLPYIALHAARNSAASLMEEDGVPDRLVAQILGHSQVQITHGYQQADLERMLSALTDMGGRVLQLPAGVPDLAQHGKGRPAALDEGHDPT